MPSRWDINIHMLEFRTFDRLCLLLTKVISLYGFWIMRSFLKYENYKRKILLATYLKESLLVKKGKQMYSKLSNLIPSIQHPLEIGLLFATSIGGLKCLFSMVIWNCYAKIRLTFFYFLKDDGYRRKVLLWPSSFICYTPFHLLPSALIDHLDIPIAYLFYVHTARNHLLQKPGHFSS